MSACANKLRLIRCLLLTTPAFAQSFEVASVRPDPPGPAPLAPGCAGGRFTARIGILSTIAWDYGAGTYQLAGFEKWPAARASFAIEGVPAVPASLPQCRLMLQTLLADRFKLAVHREARPVTVYALVAAKNGPKIQPAGEADTDGVHINGTRTYGTPKGWSIQEPADFLGGPCIPRPWSITPA
jgi:uncharacterized protein (TIGR03435 family)